MCRTLPAILLAVLAGIIVARAPTALGAEAPPLQLEDKIPLGDVRGRIDHMAVDLARHRLFVAALGNDSLAVVDLASKRLERLIGGLPEPQGVAYDRTTDTVYVANAGDGSVRFFNNGDLSPVGQIELGSDADNIRIDSKAGQVFVGHGDGAVAVIDAPTRSKTADVPLKAHPESFQLDAARIFVNVPSSGTIDVIDRISRQKIASWPTEGRSANFAMVLDEARQHLLVAFRRPAELGVFSLNDGALVGTVSTCGDVDDLFLDSKRNRIYISCGDGFVDVLAVDGDTYRQIDRFPTAAGARTSLFVPELDRLLVAAPAKGDAAAAIFVFRPSP
jgi:DNA-binding beta-propeller fold protein YncE